MCLYLILYIIFCLFQTGNSPDQIRFYWCSDKHLWVEHPLDDNETLEDLGMDATDHLKVRILPKNLDYIPF